ARFCKPYGRARAFREPTAEDLAALSRYNLQDVLLLARLHAVLDAPEPELLALDRVINERGICFDQELAQAVLALEAADPRELPGQAELATEEAIKAPALTKRGVLGSWLASRGIPLPLPPSGKPQLRKGDVEALLARKELPADVRAVLRARRA